MTNVGNGGEAETTADHEVSPVVRKAVCPTQVGSMLDRFRLDEVLGHGVFSTVFKAFDTTLDLPVVVKVLGKNASVDAIERFRREIVFSRRLAHPGFSRIFEFHEVQAGEVPSEDAADGARLRYLTMEFIEGRTLGDLMNEGPMPERRALTIARDLCDIVAVAHEQGVAPYLRSPAVSVAAPFIQTLAEATVEALSRTGAAPFGPGCRASWKACPRTCVRRAA